MAPHCRKSTGQNADKCSELLARKTGQVNLLSNSSKTGRCKLSIRKSPEYGDQNQIQDYVKDPAAARSASSAQATRRPLAPVGAGGPSWSAPKGGGDDLNDDIPF